MLTFNIGLGLFFMLFGFLIKKYPNLIAGYNTMSATQKANVDIAGLTTFMFKGFMLMGLLMISGDLILKWLLWTDIRSMLILIVTLGILPVVVVGAQRFDHNKASQSKVALTIVILVISIVFVGGIFYYGLKTPELCISSNALQINGMYGLEVEVRDFELVDSIPKIETRTNGFSALGVRKGNFKLDQIGNATLFLSSNSGPYIRIRTKDNRTIFVNGKYDWHTKSIYERLRSSL